MNFFLCQVGVEGSSDATEFERIFDDGQQYLRLEIWFEDKVKRLFVRIFLFLPALKIFLSLLLLYNGKGGLVKSQVKSARPRHLMVETN